MVWAPPFCRAIRCAIQEAGILPSGVAGPSGWSDYHPRRRASGVPCTAGSGPETTVNPRMSEWAEPESTFVNASPGGSTRAANHSVADLVDPSIHTTQGTGAQGKTPGRRHTLSSERGSLQTQEKEQNSARCSVKISAVTDPANSGFTAMPMSDGAVGDDGTS